MSLLIINPISTVFPTSLHWITMDFLAPPDHQPFQSQNRQRTTSYHCIPLDLHRISIQSDDTRSSSTTIQLDETASNSSFNHETLYRITDFVLIMCAIIFIVSSIAYGAIWVYGTINAGRSVIIKTSFVSLIDDVK